MFVQGKTLTLAMNCALLPIAASKIQDTSFLNNHFLVIMPHFPCYNLPSQETRRPSLPDMTVSIERTIR